ncbi:MAG: hypothetical protein IJ789_01595 [Bacteroidales bacterium]|nr:hypothetical protein [Bacteroidales bacterium]
MVYKSYSYSITSEGLRLAFEFEIDAETVFRPVAVVENRSFLDFAKPKELMDALVFNIGMIELISYWKSFCPPTVEVVCGQLDACAIDFWRKTYWHGLGEFFYTNNIATTSSTFMTIVAPTPDGAAKPLACNLGQGYIVPIGGGKDSVVTLEALAHEGRPLPLIMNPRGATIGCTAAAGYTLDEVAVIRRTIDPLLLQLNAAGCLNGHTPFSAMLAFYTLLVAACSGRANIALSNESSANEATVPGTEVNHQYSKSLEFEDDFRRYVATHIAPQFNYFSFLRPLSELQIAMLFARHERYHDVFRSCNAGSKTDSWCGHCAKCLFAFIILSPFLPPQRLATIFGHNLLDDESLRHDFDQLTGRAEVKPFECVGTVSEVNSALSMTLDRWYAHTARPALLRHYDAQPPTTPLTTLLPNHNLDSHQIGLLKQCIEKNS